ncbi:MAG: TonB-dependent receptor, partial [Undibacterium sp.]|nr:TonB-dependent receptor [Undibacterium sp.]
MNTPSNIGHALAKGIELEAKFPLQEYFPDGPAIDFRSNCSRFWSSVDQVRGPNNRLDQQPTQTANVGMDYKLPNTGFTFGGNLNWTPAYSNQTSDTQAVYSGVKRQLDVYSLWKISPAVKLRLSASNLEALDSQSGSSVYADGINYTQGSRSKTFKVLTLRLEIKI